jgi:hypothetical protein
MMDNNIGRCGLQISLHWGCAHHTDSAGYIQRVLDTRSVQPLARLHEVYSILKEITDN